MSNDRNGGADGSARSRPARHLSCLSLTRFGTGILRHLGALGDILFCAGLADLASLFDPSAFIVGGGLSDEGELVLDPIRKSYKRWLVGGNWRPVADVIAAQLGNEAGLVGAADLAREPDPIM